MSSLALVSTAGVLSRKVQSVTTRDESDYAKYKKQWGNRLQALLDKRHMKQADLARKLGHKNPSQISRYARGEVLPNLSTRREIARILGVSIAYLDHGADG